MQGSVLFISPYTEDADTLSDFLRPLSIALDHAEDFHRARLKLDRESYGAILTEAQLPDGNWEDVLNLAEQASLPSTVVVTHPFADARFWADAMELGAYDLLAQPFSCSEVQRILSNALLVRGHEARKIAHGAL